jgi:hypothetical protein
MPNYLVYYLFIIYLDLIYWGSGPLPLFAPARSLYPHTVFRCIYVNEGRYLLVNWIFDLMDYVQGGDQILQHAGSSQ